MVWPRCAILFRRLSAAFAIVGALIVLAGYGAPALAAEQLIQLTETQARSLGIRVVHPIPSPTDKTLALPAQIVIPTSQLWVVSAPVAGMVSSISVARGDRVTRGQILVTLESPSFVAAQRDYLQSLAQEVLLAQQVRRETALFKEKALAERVLQASQTEARQASIAVAERRQVLRLSGMSDGAIAQLTSEAKISAKLEVSAPEDGTITEVVISPGLRLDQSAPMLKLGRLSPLWAEIAVPAADVRDISPGARVEIDGYDVPGRVVLVSETIDPATQTVLVRAEIPNNGGLRPGQTAAARIGFVSHGGAAWEIPYAGLVRRGEVGSIFVATSGGFRVVPVTVLAEDQDHVVVAADITENDEIAVSGVAALRGMLLGLGAGE